MKDANFIHYWLLNFQTHALRRYKIIFHISRSDIVRQNRAQIQEIVHTIKITKFIRALS